MRIATIALAILITCASTARSQNQVLVLDGAGDHVRASSLADLGGISEYTIECWVRSDAPNHADKLLDMGQDPNQRIGVQASCSSTEQGVETWQEWGFQNGTSVSQQSPAHCDGQWHHLAATSDPSTLTFYFDGELVESVPSIGAVMDFDGMGMAIGGHINPIGKDWWQGAIDDMRIWRRALDASELQRTCPGEEIASTQGLVSWWRFDGDAIDSVGPNDAALHGDASFEVVEICPSGPLVVAPSQVSLSGGGTATFTLDAGPTPVFNAYLLLGSATGTEPGLSVDDFVLPLVYDVYTAWTLSQPNQGPFGSTFGILSGGQGSATLTVPAGTDASLAGLVLHHAYVVIELTSTVDPEVVFVSNAVGVTLVP